MKRKSDTQERLYCTEYDSLDILKIVWRQDWSDFGCQGCYRTPDYLPHYPKTRGYRRILQCKHKLSERYESWRYLPGKYNK